MIDREALREFKAICEDIGHPCTDEEALKMAERVIRFLRASEERYQVPVRPLPKLSLQEQIVFDLIKSGRSPSIREITQAIGLSSSRSGQRIVESLMRKGIITRDESGSLIVLP
jgi:hypothetical protein